MDTGPQDDVVHVRPQDDSVHLAVERAAAAIRQMRESWMQAAEQMNAMVRRLALSLQPLVEIANSPEGRALVALHEAGLLPARAEHCRCLCGIAHPGEHPCWGAVPPKQMRRVPIRSETLGEVRVSMCPACAELSSGRAVTAQ